MSTNKPLTPAYKAIGDFAPKLVELTDEVLFGDVWERRELSKRDRSLITCAALVATGKTDQMSFHAERHVGRDARERAVREEAAMRRACLTAQEHELESKGRT